MILEKLLNTGVEILISVTFGKFEIKKRRMTKKNHFRILPEISS